MTILSLPKTPIVRTFTHDQADKPFVEVGAEVVCPNRYCRKHIAFFVKPLMPGEVLSCSHLLGPSIHRGMETKCHHCGIAWFLMETSQVHLRSGWLPKY